MSNVRGKGMGMGPSGTCVCLKCGYSISKRRGVPCLDEKCPKCGAALVRKGGDHYFKANKTKKRSTE